MLNCDVSQCFVLDHYQPKAHQGLKLHLVTFKVMWKDIDLRTGGRVNCFQTGCVILELTGSYTHYKKSGYISITILGSYSHWYQCDQGMGVLPQDQL